MRGLNTGAMDDVQFAFHLYRWHFMRFLHFRECINDPGSFNDISRMDNDQDGYVYTMLNVELIVSFLSFLEVLPIYLRNLRNLKNVQMALHRYQVDQVERFYRDVGQDDWKVVYGYLGYDTCTELDVESQQAYNLSAKSVREELVRCGQFYLDFKGLLNSYKHGMRVVSFEAPHPKCKFGYFPDRSVEARAIVVMWNPGRTERVFQAFAFLITVLIELVEVFGTAREIMQQENESPRELVRTLYTQSETQDRL